MLHELFIIRCTNSSSIMNPFTTHKYVQKLCSRLEWPYKHIHCSKLAQGDLILSGQRTFKGKHKIQRKTQDTGLVGKYSLPSPGMNHTKSICAQHSTRVRNY